MGTSWENLTIQLGLKGLIDCKDTNTKIYLNISLDIFTALTDAPNVDQKMLIFAIEFDTKRNVPS